MSGIQDVEIEAISLETLEAERKAREKLEARRAEVALLLAEADARAVASGERFRAAEATTMMLRQQHADMTRRLDELTTERQGLSRRIREMKQSTRDAQREAEQLRDAIGTDVADIERQRDSLESARRDLEREIGNIEQVMAQHVGGEAREATEELARISGTQLQIHAEAATLEVELAAFAASATLGVVVKEFLDSAAAVGFVPRVAHRTEGEAEVEIVGTQKETFRIAVRLDAEKARPADQRLHLTLRGDDRDHERCLARVVEILRKLNERGIVTTVTADAGRLPADDRLDLGSRTRTREGT